jgi:hypothetical protein
MTIATQTVAQPAGQHSTTLAPDLAALKTRQKAAWSSGDYAVVGATVQIVGEEFAKLSIFGQARKCSTWRPATEMSASRPHGAGATSFRPTMCRACLSAAGLERQPMA